MATPRAGASGGAAMAPAMRPDTVGAGYGKHPCRDCRGRPTRHRRRGPYATHVGHARPIGPLMAHHHGDKIAVAQA